MSSYNDALMLADDQPPVRRPGTRIIVASILAVGVLLAVVCWILLWRPAILLGVDRKAVAYSVSGEAGSQLFRSTDSCTHAKRRIYICSITEPSGSGGAQYRVVVDGRGCWRGTVIEQGSEGPMPEHPSSCISMWDYQRVWNAL